MNTRRFLVLSLVFLSLASLTLAGCGGKKRPPVVATGTGVGVPPTAPVSGRSASQPVEEGPDVRPVGNEGALGEDIMGGDLSGEGGPLADIHFEYDQASLTEEARAILEKHATWLQTRRDVQVTVEGHCDERGTVEYNLALGDQRAVAARDYLLSLGVAADRLKIISYGKERPLDPGHDDGAWARNRRAHFAVSRARAGSS